MSDQQHSLDIVIPCFNPDLDWENKLIQYFLELSKELGEGCATLILVNDGSTSEVSTSHIEKIKSAIPGMTYLECSENKGKGHALRIGVESSNSKLTIFTDVDFPYEIESVVSLYEELCTGTDVALGYRERDYYTTVPLFRKLLSQALRWVLKSVLKLSITDTQCGLKGFNKSGKRVFLATTINRFLFDLEFVMLLSKDSNISTKPVLVKLRDGVVFSRVNMKVLIVELFNFLGLAFSKRKPPPNV